MIANPKTRFYMIQSIGIFISLIVFSFIGNITQKNLLVAPFAASLIILFTCYEHQFSKTKNVIGGYIICSVTGMLVYAVLGNNLFTIAVAVSIATLLMMLTTLLHPPAAAVTIIVVSVGVKWSFVFYPVLFGAVLLVLLAMLYHYSLQWFVPGKKKPPLIIRREQIKPCNSCYKKCHLDKETAKLG